MRLSALVMGGVGLLIAAVPSAAQDLPSWEERAARTAIVEFVEAVTDAAGPDFVPPAERVAVFDNDGTLWLEQPMYTQLAYALDRVQALAPDHPEWADDPTMQAAIAGDLASLAEGGTEALLALVMATHAGITSDAFAEAVADWLATAQHPRFERPYTALVYQPMLELLDYLRANEFKTFIVSGGGVDFMRVFALATYGIPPEQVVGSTIKAEYAVEDGEPVIVKQPEVALIDDGPGKPVGIHAFIGHRPILAFGNSDGDFEMLEWTTAGDGRRLGLLVHHDDAAREYAYDRESPFGRLDRGLDEAAGRGWLIVSMRNDWRTVFPEAAP